MTTRHCGCTWMFRYDDSGPWLVFTHRCAEHIAAQRHPEAWEIDIEPPEGWPNVQQVRWPLLDEILESTRHGRPETD